LGRTQKLSNNVIGTLNKEIGRELWEIILPASNKATGRYSVIEIIDLQVV
jgi:hypothetical protein